MKRILFILLAISTSNALNERLLASPPIQSMGVGVNFGFFYSSLRPHGEWIETEPGIQVWRPFGLPSHWRPYIIGRWIWTDYGWYWMSDEPFGWVTYHYGRWYDDEYYGWIWVPDDTWGPAWVEWRYDNDYIGWAPLPPYATFNISFGIRFTHHWVAPVHYWNFIHYRHFGSVHHYSDMLPERQTRRLIHTTRSGPLHQVDHDRVINRGVDRSIIERRGNVQISRTEVRDVHERSGEQIIRSTDNRRVERVDVYRPSRDEMQRSTERIEAKRGERALSIDMNKINQSRIDRSQERIQREPSRTSEVQRDRTIQRAEQRQENRPRVREQKQQPDRKEMRRELIQRQNKQNPSPPANRESSRQRVQRQRDNSQRESSVRTPSERKSGRSSNRRRGE